MGVQFELHSIKPTVAFHKLLMNPLKSQQAAETLPKHKNQTNPNSAPPLSSSPGLSISQSPI